MAMGEPAGGSNLGRKRTGWPGSAPAQDQGGVDLVGDGVGREDGLVLLGALEAEQVLQRPLAEDDPGSEDHPLTLRVEP